MMGSVATLSPARLDNSSPFTQCDLIFQFFKRNCKLGFLCENVGTYTFFEKHSVSQIKYIDSMNLACTSPLLPVWCPLAPKRIPPKTITLRAGGRLPAGPTLPCACLGQVLCPSHCPQGTQMVPHQGPLQSTAPRLLSLPLALKADENKAWAAQWAKPQGVSGGRGATTCLLGFLFPLLLLKMFIHSYFLSPLRQPGQSVLPGAEPHDPQGGSCLHMAAPVVRHLIC